MSFYSIIILSHCRKITGTDQNLSLLFSADFTYERSFSQKIPWQKKIPIPGWIYRCTVREVRTKLEVLNDEFSVEYKRNPISFIKTRIKKPESIYKKLKKLGYEFTAENIQNQLNDVAGIRVVCAFIDDIYTIADLISKQDDITVIQVKDYIKNPKPNGYRSYHMIVEIPVFFSKGKTPMRAEIQIRTNGMDFWATLEHQLRYKQNIEEMDGYEEVSDELLNCARAVIDMDNEMQRIKDKIGQFHDI